MGREVSRVGGWWGCWRRRAMGIAAILVVFGEAALVLAGAAPFERRRDKSDEFFESGVIPQVRIEITGTNLSQLRKHKRTYVRSTIREGDRVYEEVGIHLKGAAGSSRELDDRPALTLNFDKFRDGQKFHGLDKLHLNNSVQDESLLTEALCSELFLAADVPTARTTHARVWLNGRDLGLYVLKEGYDRSFLKRHFRNPKGNLYDGGFLRDITDQLQRDSGDGDVEAYRDLRAVVRAAREPDFTKRVGRLEQVLDVERFLSFLALEILTEHWDGYALKRNNYRVYHDPDANQCVFIPHGMDQMFWSPSRPFIPPEGQLEGLVARALLQTAEGRMRYRARLGQIATNLFTVERLTNHFNQLQARLAPALATLREDQAQSHQREMESVRRKMLARLRWVHARVGAPTPESIEFDATGVAPLTRWQRVDPKNTGMMDEVTLEGRRMLHIVAGEEGKCVASWRTALQLKRGQYQFEARVRTAGVVRLPNEPITRGSGAGIRVSQDPRTNQVIGDTDWQLLTHTITVAGELSEPELVCELRAAQGEVWFELDSLRLRKVEEGR
jgi:spore coat protein H